MTASAGPISMIRPRYMTAIRSAITQASDRSWVMNRYVRPRSRAQVEHQPQELGPDRDVEHRDRLVGDDELRVHDERAGDDDALALAARQLVRVAGGEVRGRPQAGRLERVEDRWRSRSARPRPMPLTTSGSATKSKIVCFGFSVSYGSWKISWTRRR